MNLQKLLALTLLAIGIAISAYLLTRQLVLLQTDKGSGVDVCRAVLGVGCDDTLSSSTSIQLGIPLAGWGIIFYAATTVLLGLGWAQGTTFESQATAGALFISAIAALLGIILSAMMVMGIAPICILCFTVHALNIGLVFLVKSMTGKNIRAVMQDIAGAVKYLMGAPVEDPIAAGWRVCGFVIPALIGVIVYQWVLIQTNRLRVDHSEQIARYEAEAVTEIPVNAEDPRIGPKDAPVQMVVFSSFQCPGCQSFARIMHELSLEFGEGLSVVFKHFPLNVQCNPDLEVDLHPQACSAARAAESARLNDVFWRFHDATFFLGDMRFEETLKLIARQNKIDEGKILSDWKSERSLEKLKADIQLGNKLSIDATPTVFVNGRKISSVSHEVLRAVILHELRK